MVSLLIDTQAADLPEWLFSALNVAGLDAAPVLHEGTDLVRVMGAGAPDMLLCWSSHPDDAWLSAAIAARQPDHAYRAGAGWLLNTLAHAETLLLNCFARA